MGGGVTPPNRTTGRGETGEDRAKRFWAKVAQPNAAGCWLWTASVTGKGHVKHGQFTYRANGRQLHVKAHRLAWELANGRPVPAGLKVMHLCDNPACVNPAHLIIGTIRDNILDSIRKGRYNTFGIRKLNAEQVREIRALSSRGLRQIDIAQQFGIARNTVSSIVNGKTWAHLDEGGA